jgi:hypothetical protein
VKALSLKFKAAARGIQHTQASFLELDNSLPSDLREAWLKSEEIALEFRGEDLKLYDVRLEKGALGFLTLPRCVK